MTGVKNAYTSKFLFTLLALSDAAGFATPLMAVCGSQKGTEAALVTCAEVLLKHGADPDLADR